MVLALVLGLVLLGGAVSLRRARSRSRQEPASHRGPRRGRVTTSVALVVAVLTVVAAGVASWDVVVQTWYILTLDSVDRSRRLEAARKLGEAGCLRAAPRLLRLAEEDAACGMEATVALVRIGSTAVRELIEVLERKDPDFRVQAVEAIAAAAPPPVAGASVLVELAVRDAEERVSGLAMGKLRGLGRAAVPHLLEVLKSPDTKLPAGRDPLWSLEKRASFHSQALRALEMLGTDAEPAIPLLAEWLQRDDPLGLEAASVLASIGEAAVPALAQILGSGRPVARLAAVALGKIGPEAGAAVPALIRAARDPDFGKGRKTWLHNAPGSCDPRSHVVIALGKVGAQSDQVVPALIDALRSDQSCLREAAAGALGEIGPSARDAVPDLVALVEGSRADLNRHSHPDARALAAAALGRIAPGSAVAAAALVRALSSPDKYVRSAALEALAQCPCLRA